jgi:DNA-binding PadR family transcriptional regulator
VRRQVKKGSRGLTELEGSVLGMIGVKGPCTPYALRREFMESPSQYWSASSGAVYPLMIRLRRRGLIRVSATTGDGREGRVYGLTPAGRRALQDWLATVDAPATISVPPDPLRNRIAFFQLLDDGRQRSCLASAVEALQDYLDSVRAHTVKLEAHGDRNEFLVSVGAERMVRARLDWLVEVVRATGSKPPP